MNQELIKYIEQNIFPKYERFYSHGMIHIENVIKNVMMLADFYNLDKNMAYTMAAYHDVGLSINRDKHEFESGKILENDIELKKFFTLEQIQIMKEAVEDHRGSRKISPRNIYGKVLSDSDRDLAKRQLGTSIKNYPDIKDFEDHFERCYSYIMKRINETGHFNLWTNNPILIERRVKFEKDYFNKEYTELIYRKEFERISKDGTIEKIKNYYEDY